MSSSEQLPSDPRAAIAILKDALEVCDSNFATGEPVEMISKLATMNGYACAAIHAALVLIERGGK